MLKIKLNQKQRMKKLLLLSITIITLNSCSSDESDNNPNLSFNIASTDLIASSKITANNTSTNYNGTYIWEVSSVFGTETFSTENLTFNANRVSDYTIKLRTSSNEFETEQIITTTQPTKLEFKKLTLKDIPQDYSTLYFQINKISTSGSTTIYTSASQQNISSLAPSVVDWNIDIANGVYNLTDGSDINNINTYQIEFFDGNNNLITKLNPFGNLYDMNSEYIAGEEELTTTSTNCNNCDYFKVLADFGFRN
jgi:membrane-associated HD superfamily phosphohydrolase